MSKSITMTIRLAPEDRDTLRLLAERERRPLASYLSLVLTDHALAHKDSLEKGSGKKR